MKNAPELAMARKIGLIAMLAGLVCYVTPGAAAPAARYDARAKAEYGPIFTQVLQKFIASMPGLNICLPPLFGYGDVVNDTTVVNPDAEGPVVGAGVGTSPTSQLKSLEAAGLVSGIESTREVNGKVVRNVTYRRTAKGLAVSQGPSICYARGELDRIVKWKGPIALGEYQAAFVYYTVKTAHIESWANSPDVQAAFPTMKSVVKGEETKVRQIVIDLSSEGWDVAEYSKFLQMQ